MQNLPLFFIKNFFIKKSFRIIFLFFLLFVFPLHADSLFDSKIQTNKRDSADGLTPLALAVREGNASKVKHLIKKGASIDARVGYSNKTALIIAASIGNLEILKILIIEGADLNVKDTSNRTPLSFASEYGYLEIVKHLLEHKADPNIKDKDGFKPSDYAKNNRNYVVMEVLLHRIGKMEIEHEASTCKGVFKKV